MSSRDLRNFSQSLGQSNMPPPVGTPSCGTNEGTLSFHPSMGVASPAAAAVASFHTMRRSSYNKTSANSGSSGHGAGVGGSVFEPGQCLIFLIFHFPSMFHQEKETKLICHVPILRSKDTGKNPKWSRIFCASFVVCWLRLNTKNVSVQFEIIFKISF